METTTAPKIYVPPAYPGDTDPSRASPVQIVAVLAIHEDCRSLMKERPAGLVSLKNKPAHSLPLIIPSAGHSFPAPGLVIYTRPVAGKERGYNKANRLRSNTVKA